VLRLADAVAGHVGAAAEAARSPPVRLWYTPTGFIPAQDQAYFFTIIQLPPGSSTARTDAVMKKVAERMLPIPGIKNTVMLSGFDGASETRSASSAAAYWVLDDFEDARKGQTIDKLMAEAAKATADITEARLLIVKPPLIRGIGSAGGYRLMIEDRDGKGYKALEQTAYGLIGKANQTPGLSYVYTFFETGTPRVFADIDREKARCSACRRSACSRRCRSISARRSSTTSTCSAAPIM
jgi:multidrug efflux pump subunit AcrB